MNTQTKALKMMLDLIPNEEAKKFWKETYEEGITLQELANELSDMHIMIENVPKIVNAVTGGLLSYATYPAETVIAKFNDYVDEIVQEAVKEAIAQPVQENEASSLREPVAWLSTDSKANEIIKTHPAPLQNEFAKTKSWQGLSDDEMSIIFDKFDWKEVEIAGEHLDLFKFARAIEQALRSKNEQTN